MWITFVFNHKIMLVLFFWSLGNKKLKKNIITPWEAHLLKTNVLWILSHYFSLYHSQIFLCFILFSQQTLSSLILKKSRNYLEIQKVRIVCDSIHCSPSLNFKVYLSWGEFRFLSSEITHRSLCAWVKHEVKVIKDE